jgi:hypothetical protein
MPLWGKTPRPQITAKTERFSQKSIENLAADFIK